MKHVPRQKQSVVKTAEAVTTVIVTEINKGTIKVNVRIMIVATKMEMVKATVIMGTAVTIVIVTVISKVNSAMIKVEINVTILPVTIRQDHVLTLKRVRQPRKQSKMQNIHVKVKHASVKKKAQSNAVRKEQEKARKEKQQAEVAAQKQLLKLSQLPNQHRLLQPAPVAQSSRYTS